MTGECTCSALRMAARRLTQTYDAALAPEGISTPQYALLNRLGTWPGEPPTVQQLAERLGLDRTTLAHNLRPLERAGLVAVASDPRDRRVRRIRLTPPGRTKRDVCDPLWRAAQDKFERAFGTERVSALMDTLKSIPPINAPSTEADPQRENSDAG